MAFSLSECWDEWPDEDGAAAAAADRAAGSTDDPTAVEHGTYAKRFVPSASARRSAGMPRGGASDVATLWALVETMEEWREEQARLMRMTMVIMLVAYALLLCRLHTLSARLSAGR